MVPKTAVAHERAGQARNLDRWPVTAIMSRPAVAIRDTATMAEALEALAITGLRHLAVVDAAGRCVGVLDDRMVTAAWAVNPISFSATPIASALDPLPSVITENMTVADAARSMHRSCIDVVVITDRQRMPVGVLTTGDLIAIMAKPR